VVRIFGPDLDTLRAHASEVSAAIKDVTGVSALKVEALTQVPQITVKVRADLASLHGLTVGRVSQAVAAMVSGKKVGEVYQNQRVHDVVVWSAPGVRDSYTALRDLLLETPSGGHVRLSDVAELAVVPTPNAIKRESASRRLDVTCNVAGRALGDVVKEIEQRVAGISFKPGHHPEVLGEWAERQAAQSRLGWLAGASLLGIFAILLADFQSMRLTLLVGLTLPFALIGGVFSVWWFGGGMLSLGSLVGFVTVLGIAARNGILLVSHYEFLRKNEGMKLRLETVLRGSEERLVPILMTAGTAALALIPLVCKGDVPGNEIERPLALVILGGLATSTVLNFFILPSLYARFASSGVLFAQGPEARQLNKS
jgi:Cu/Ag efflux pump CusA